MADNDPTTSILHKIEREKALINGAIHMRQSSNPAVQQTLDVQIKEYRKNLGYLEDKLKESRMRQGMEGLSLGQDSNGGSPPPTHGGASSQQKRNNTFGYASGQSQSGYGQGGYMDQMGAGSGMMPPKPPYGPQAPNSSIPKARPNYSKLDLIKADTPYLAQRFQLMSSQLTFKLNVEKQYKDGIEKLVRLYADDGIKRSKADAEARLVESTQKIQLLRQALKRYEDLNVDMDSGDVGDDDSINSPGLRKPLSGHLTMRIHDLMEVNHTLTGRFTRSPETFVIIKVEDTLKGKTRSTRTDKWVDEVHTIDIDKANEIELTVYDKSSGSHPTPIGMLWIRISDIVEEMRRKKIESELSGSQWVTAEQMDQAPGSRGGHAHGGSHGGKFETNPRAGGGRGPEGNFNPAGQGGDTDSSFVDARFALEPVGSIWLTMSFTKQNRGKAQADLGLNRKGAVRQRKEEVLEQYGHRFITQQFYSIMRCALCGELLKDAAGMQCEDCKYTCHRNCFSKVVTKCISKSNAETDPDEEKLNHRIPHRFEPFSNLSANWCCHCGYLLPFGRKNARKCTECALTVHASCSHLIPDFCGISMLRANEILSTIIKVRKPQPVVDSRRGGPLSAGTLRPERPVRASAPSYDAPPSQESAARPKPEPRRSYGYEPNFDQPPRTQQAPSYVQAAAQNAAMKASTPVSPDRPSYPPRTQSSQQNAAAAAAAVALSGPQRANPFGQPPDYNVRQGARQTNVYPAPEAQQEAPSDPSTTRQSPQSQHLQYDPAAYAPFSGAYNTQQQTPQYHQQPPIKSTYNEMPQAQQITSQAPSQAVVKPQQAQQPAVKDVQQQAPRTRIGLEHFNFLAVLGKGNFGKVMLAETKATKKLYAIKVLKKEFIIENDEVESTKSEKRVFLVANKERHPFLLNLHACFQTETRVYFVMEYISGGDLMLHIQRGQFGLKRAQFYAAEVCLALKYFHENGVIYRDLKLDNIMLTLDGHIKVGDYGLCKEDMWYGSTTGTFCGTPEFMAPEILLDKKYGRAVDWWAFGVLIYQMLLQQSPFRGEDEDEIYDAILADEPLYPIHMPRDSVSILQKLLTREPELRLGSGPTDAQEIMSHAFFRNVNWEDVREKKVPPPFMPTIKNPTDTSNFDNEFTSVTPVLTPVQSVLTQAMQEEFRGFSYSADFV